MYGLCIYLTACLVLLLLLFAAAAAVLFVVLQPWAQSFWIISFGNPMSRISLKLEKMLWVLSDFNVKILCGS